MTRLSPNTSISPGLKFKHSCSTPLLIRSDIFQLWLLTNSGQNLFSSDLLQGIDLSSYPFSDPEKNAEIEVLVSRNISQSVFKCQDLLTSLPSGSIDGNSPYAPKSVFEILGLPRPPDRSNTNILLGSVHLLSHSHMITYGGNEECEFFCFLLILIGFRELLLVFVCKIACFTNLEYFISCRSFVKVCLLSLNLYSTLTFPLSLSRIDQVE